jgi:predicted MPP superfamily phosphohydrolase
MFKKLIFLLGCLIGLVLVSYKTVDHAYVLNNLKPENGSLDTLLINDGPYIFIANDSLIEKRVNNGLLETKALSLQTIPFQFNDESSTYFNVSKIAALSDIHGQYKLTLTLLKNNGIIDASDNWIYGDGHLVIVGDIFDRGPQVTELLWFIFNLEKQAEQAGGKVHYLLGNHEYMVMLNDLRYINKKYRQTERILRIPYSELYGNETILGRWLRSKSTIIKINDNLFVHAGISSEFIESGFDLDATNQKMRLSLTENETDKKWDSIYSKYYDSYGPIWYRGYFSNELNNKEINKLLKTIKVKHIVVGHTSQTQIETLFKNRIIAVDTSIKNGISGELLFIENGHFYRGTINGQKIKIKK